VKIRLEKERDEKNLLAAEKLKEESNLKTRMKENTQLISLLKKNKTELKKEIDSKRKAEGKITALINKLIADAEKKRKAELERLTKLEKNKSEVQGKAPLTDYDLDMAGLSSFKAMKGSLNWPLHGKIKLKFGENKNPLLNTVTLNYGVDIEAAKDLNVKCVADGIVSAIDWIPGYGSVIIITHSEDYRTVYSRLSEIFVTEGEKVKAGKLIAKVGESIEGKILHFEIWSSRNNQNPEIWLARK
jgi:septal ring factor EnvC (AmiA/AmiB activator)